MMKGTFRIIKIRFLRTTHHLRLYEDMRWLLVHVFIVHQFDTLLFCLAFCKSGGLSGGEVA